MSEPKHIEDWRTIREDALAACDVPVVAYAIVALGEDGKVHYGAQFPLTPLANADLAYHLRRAAVECEKTLRAQGGTS